MREKALHLLGLMRRANAIQIGEDKAGAAVHGGKARLLLLASDASDNARHRAEQFVNGRRTLLLELPFTKAELAGALGVSGGAMAALTDLGFDKALMDILAAMQPERYAADAEEIARRTEKAQRRKKETAAKRKMSTGKRRTKE